MSEPHPGTENGWFEVSLDSYTLVYYSRLTMAAETSVLILDPDPQTCPLLVEAVEKLGWTATVADSSLQALELIQGSIDILIADLDSPGLDGLEVVRRARRDHARMDVVVIASSASLAKATEAVRLGIPDYLARPFGAAEVKRVLARLAEKHSAASVAAKLAPAAEREMRKLVGPSAAMEKVREAVLKAAARRLPVLVLGESGTGKELVAKAIHACGPWHDEPFVPIDCGALAPNLVESELFGHVKGAFTGATQSRPGLLVEAGRGTLLLDEIGELPVELQARLLRVLQEREVRPVGANEHVPMEARVIAATNVNLKEAVHEGTFRQDLYYRLNVFTIRIPALRERREDILALVNHFIKIYGPAEGVADFSPEFMNRLMQYNWPGNVRELENAVQRALALSSGVRLEFNDLPSTLAYRGASRAEAADTARLQDLERRAIKEALEAVGGDRVRAAKLLGIGKTTIYRKLKEYGLEEGEEPPSTPPPGS
jgi:DNA-binding NtrC family response regulator